MTGTNNAGFDFRTVVRFPVVVFLDDDQRQCLDFLIGCKTFPADRALTSAANGSVVVGRTGINHTCILCAAKWVFHIFFLLYIRESSLLTFIINNCVTKVNLIRRFLHTFFEINVHKNDICTNLADAFPTDQIFGIPTEEAAEAGGPRKNQLTPV